MKLFYVANNQLPTTKAHGLQIMKMCEAFARQGVDCTLIVPERSLDPQIATDDPFAFYGVEPLFPILRLVSLDLIRWQSIPGIGTFLFWLQQHSFARNLRAYLLGSDGIVYSRDPFALAALKGTTCRLYWEAHNVPRNLTGAWYGRILRRLDGLVVITRGLEKAFTRTYRGPMLIAPDATDVTEFQTSLSKAEARRRLDLPQDASIAMYVGHLYPWKGVQALVRALSDLDTTYRVVIVGGTADDRTALEAATPPDCRSRLIMRPYVPHPEVAGYLAAADCLVLTGNQDDPMAREYTSPLKLFEYMASRRPIVAQALPSFREVLTSDVAVMVEPASSQALAQGIQTACRDTELSQRMVDAAFSAVHEHTWEKRAEQIRRFIER